MAAFSRATHRVALVVSEAKTSNQRGDAQLEEDIGTIEAPPEREKLPAVKAGKYQLRNTPLLLPAELRNNCGLWAPKRLHVGRLTPIQGRSVGEWHRQHRSRHANETSQYTTIRDRLTGRTPRSERGGRGSIPCPGTHRRVAQWESACLTSRGLLVRIQPCRPHVAVAQSGRAPA
jgi:hypothetical protein